MEKLEVIAKKHKIEIIKTSTESWYQIDGYRLCKDGEVAETVLQMFLDSHGLTSNSDYSVKAIAMNLMYIRTGREPMLKTRVFCEKRLQYALKEFVEATCDENEDIEAYTKALYYSIEDELGDDYE